MSVSLENLFVQNNSIQSTQTLGQSQVMNNAANILLQNMFSAGEVISGKVTSMDGNIVELLLPGGQNLNALLGGDVRVNIGEQMLFSVKGMNTNQPELMPLFKNTANTTTIMKALEGAGMAVNEQNVTMVQNMMERGMSIQKDALLAVRRSMVKFPEVPVEDVVTLHSLKLPVTSENLTQLSAYKNSENQIMKPITEMMSELPNVFDTLVNKGETQKAVTLYKDFVQLFGEIEESVLNKSDNNTIMNETLHNMQGDESVNVAADENANMPQNSDFYAGNVNEQAGHILSKLGLSEGEIEALLKDNKSRQMVAKVISDVLASNSTAVKDEKLVDMFKDPVFKLFMKETGEEVATLSPKEVAQHENIDKLYEHLQKSAGKILETLSGTEDLSIVKSAENLKANVDFMNQVNQMFQYVQLPLKFTESNANGELYVYGNGKKLSLEDGDVSALLHLDMEHLGTVDIHVEMNPEKQVKTNFYFEDEAMLDFVYEHIDMLNERLEKRGYGPITNVQMRDKDTKTPVTEIFEKKEETPVLLKTQSFDARI